MKVLFLDIDGVLNSREHYKQNHADRMADREVRQEFSTGVVLNEFDKKFCWPIGHLSQILIARLNTIVEKTNCKIIISSSWRIGSSPKEIASYLIQKGFKYPDSIIDKTGQNSKDARGGEIQDYLDSHKEISNYVILDDDTADIIGDYTTKKHPNNFVHTPFEFGLQDKHIEEVIKILSN